MFDTLVQSAQMRENSRIRIRVALLFLCAGVRCSRLTLLNPKLDITSIMSIFESSGILNFSFSSAEYEVYHSTSIFE